MSPRIRLSVLIIAFLFSFIGSTAISSCRTALSVLKELAPNAVITITESIPLRGSGRLFTRATITKENGTSRNVLLMAYTGNRADNLNFLAATNFLQSQGIHVPEIINRSLANPENPDKFSYLVVEDLGPISLKDRPSEKLIRDYQKTLDLVSKLHSVQRETANKAPLEAEFDASMYLWEQNDFFREKVLKGFMNLSEAEAHAMMPREKGVQIATFLASLPKQIIHRDFQSENVIFKEETPYLIDYQGIRLGRAEYDIASLIYDPYKKISSEQREKLISYSFQNLKRNGLLDSSLNESTWRKKYFYPLAMQRLMQAMGAYARLAREEGQLDYFQHLEPARKNLIEVLERGKIFPQLLSRLKKSSFREESSQRKP